MSKPTKIWLVAGAVVLAVAFLLLFYLNDWVEAKIKSTLLEKVQAPNKLEYGSLEASFFEGKMTMKEVKATVMMGKWKRRADVTISEIKLEDISWLSLLFSKKLEIGELHIAHPFITVAKTEDLLPDTIINAAIEPKSPTQLKSINIDHISMLHGHFRFLKKSIEGPPEMEADTFNLEMGEFSLMLEKEGQPLKVVKAELDLYHFRRREEDKLHDISISHIHFSNSDSLIEISGLEVKPNFSKKEFFSQLKYKKSRLDLELPFVRFSGWNFDQLMKGNLVARTVALDQLKIGVFSDRNLPLDPNAYKKFPQETLLTAAMGITVDTIRANKAEILYENLGMDRNTPGRLLFSNIQSTLINVTNDTARIRKKPTLEIAIQAMLNEKHLLSQRVWMNLGSPSYDFTIKGHAAGIPFPELNHFLKPTQNIAFERGVIQRLDFNINANHHNASGQLSLEYDDLEFALLDDQKEKKKLLSRIVDILFVPDNNDKADKDFQKGTVYAVRDVRRSFYHFFWSAIQSGIQSSILSEKAAGKLTKQVKKK